MLAPLFFNLIYGSFCNTCIFTTMSQLTDTLVMVAPTDFAFNEQTAANNEFQNRPALPLADLRAQVRAEFNEAVRRLRGAGVQVLVLEKPEGLPAMPDAIFPNNWFGMLATGRAFVYKMASQNRRAETQQWPALQALLTANGHQTAEVIYLDAAADAVLEGTGSLILDRVERIAYAALSERTDPAALAGWAAKAGYRQVISFNTQSSKGLPIYHTNVLMSIGQGVAVVCLEAIPDLADREYLCKHLEARHEVIDLTLAQTESHFCANILQVKGAGGPITVLSQRAHDGYTPAQRARLEAYGPLLALPIPTIEDVGGGSARCMLAEVF